MHQGLYACFFFFSFCSFNNKSKENVTLASKYFISIRFQFESIMAFSQISIFQILYIFIYIMVTRKRHSFCYNFFPFLYLIAMCIIKWNKYTGLKNSKQRLYIFINHNIKSILKNTVWYGDNVGKRMYLKSWYYSIASKSGCSHFDSMHSSSFENSLVDGDWQIDVSSSAK